MQQHTYRTLFIFQGPAIGSYAKTENTHIGETLLDSVHLQNDRFSIFRGRAVIILVPILNSITSLPFNFTSRFSFTPSKEMYLLRGCCKG